MNHISIVSNWNAPPPRPGVANSELLFRPFNNLPPPHPPALTWQLHNCTSPDFYCRSLSLCHASGNHAGSLPFLLRRRIDDVLVVRWWVGLFGSRRVEPPSQRCWSGGRAITAMIVSAVYHEIKMSGSNRSGKGIGCVLLCDPRYEEIVDTFLGPDGII